jgi:aryl-alcohol dehydrogenase-like predicted oxidoreductase
MRQRNIGGLEVGAVGYGCMGIHFAYGPPKEEAGFAAIGRAIELGATLIDTADIYGPETNEVLVGRAIASRRDEVVLATKFGNDWHGPERRINGRPEYVRSACEDSLRRLGVDVIDLYYQHRVDRTVPFSASPRPARRRSAARTPSIRSRRCRPSTRSGRATSRPRSCRRSASSASGSSPTPRSGAGS